MYGLGSGLWEPLPNRLIIDEVGKEEFIKYQPHLIILIPNLYPLSFMILKAHYVFSDVNPTVSNNGMSVKFGI